MPAPSMPKEVSGQADVEGVAIKVGRPELQNCLCGANSVRRMGEERGGTLDTIPALEKEEDRKRERRKR